MGLLNTNAILDEIGFTARRRGKSELDSILTENGLSLEESIVEVKNIIDNTTDQHLKAKLLDLVLSMHGVKKETGTPQVPSITFIFPSSEPKFLSPSEIIIEPEKDNSDESQNVELRSLR